MQLRAAATATRMLVPVGAIQPGGTRRRPECRHRSHALSFSRISAGTVMVCRRPARRLTHALPGRNGHGKPPVGRLPSEDDSVRGVTAMAWVRPLTRISCPLGSIWPGWAGLAIHAAWTMIERWDRMMLYIVCMSQYCLMCFLHRAIRSQAAILPGGIMAFATEGRPRRDCGAPPVSCRCKWRYRPRILDTEKRLFRVQAWDDRSTRAALDRYSLYRQEHRRASSGAPPVSCCTPLRLRYPPNLVFARFLFQSIAARVPTPSTNRAIPNGLPSFSASGSHASG